MASSAPAAQLTEFARDLIAGLSHETQKWLSPKYFYDEVGSALFEAITVLPEYGLTRADERLLQMHAHEIACLTSHPRVVAELGSGSGRKTRHVLLALNRPLYRPIDISAAALELCASQLGADAEVKPILGEWLSSLESLTATRSKEPLLLLFLGSSIGNCARTELPGFLAALRSCLSPGDHFLLGADLVKPVHRMLEAYDDPTGVTAAFNLNVLARANRELGGNFNLREFRHEARWNARERSIEMHLVSRKQQSVQLDAFEDEVHFEEGESIWTESSHKFTVDELTSYAEASGFTPVTTWVEDEWPFAEVLWKVS